MKTFDKKNVAITGAGSGIGRALAVEFGKLGARLALNDLHKQALEETAGILREIGVEYILTKAFDVANKKDMQHFAQEVKDAWGHAHVIINNAGIAGASRPAIDVTEEEYRRTMNINFFGVLNGCQAFLPQLIENRRGVLVNISSIFGLLGIPAYSDYCASKFAVRGYTESLMAEFHGSPISIHSVHPGGIKTNIAEGKADQTEAQKLLVTPPEDLASYIVKSIQKGRARIVYGNGSFKVWLGTRLFSQGMLKGLIGRAVK